MVSLECLVASRNIYGIAASAATRLLTANYSWLASEDPHTL